MKLKQIVNKDPDGNLITMWEFTEEQMHLLLNIAVNYLLGHGLAEIEQQEREKAVEH
jgi:hypothetical protein